MRISGKAALALAVGGVLLGSLASVAAQEGSPAPSARPKQQRAQGKHPGLEGMKRAIRAEAVLPGVNGGPVRTVRSDRGTLKSVAASSITIDEEDGTTVTVPVGEGTRIVRDGQAAKLSDLKVGDNVFTLRQKEGSADFVTRVVQAVSPERRQQAQQRREACRADPAKCKAEAQAKRAEMQAKRAACKADPTQCPAGRAKGTSRAPGVRGSKLQD